MFLCAVTLVGVAFYDKLINQSMIFQLNDNQYSILMFVNLV